MSQGIKFSAALLAVLLFLAFAAQLEGQTLTPPDTLSFARKYRVGDSSTYRLRLDQSRDSKWDFGLVSVCRIKVVVDSSSVPYDEIRWISCWRYGRGDTVDLSREADSVKPYRISMDPRGRMDLPRITISAMTEPIEDFNTFFVACGPQLGTEKLKRSGDTLIIKKNIQANFANGSDILLGADCFRVTLRMIRENKEQASIRTDFQPPAVPCFRYITPDMDTPVVPDTANNFQMVAPTGKGLFLVQYGREYFYILNTLRKSDGMLESGSMYNQLNLRVKVNCDSSWKACQTQVPIMIQRKLTLEWTPPG